MFDEDGENINPVDFTTVSIQSGGYFDYQSEAAFAQVTFRPNETFSMTAGLRYTREDRDYLPDQFIQEMPLGGLPFPCFNSDASTKTCEIGDRVVPLETVNNSISETTPMFNISYKLQDDVMIYATYSEGFKVGGYTQRIFPPEPSLPTFDPEYVKSYEIGAKTELLDNTLRANLSIFTTDYSDLQLLIAEPSRVGPYTANAGEATIEGFELELSYAAPNDFFIDLALGYTNSGYDSLTSGAVTAGLSIDQPFVFISDWNSQISISRTFTLFGGDITPRLDWSWRSGFYTNASGLPFAPAWADPLYQAPYSVINLSARWQDPQAGFSVSVGIDNINDEEYSIFGDYQVNFGSDGEAFDRGRQWYLMLGYSF